ncbi:hypothetical protein G4B88_029568 [Cannabis sativa]|uniref:Uncharacterized protein n=1 Tax=Cannabis sativa TaxID=3483 RepID=A0A7J6FI83_CANSA|nr:hypothetical protein G4B88_029568 [Cannabis sativa]
MKTTKILRMEHGTKKNAIDIPNRTRSTRNISEQSSEIPITTPSLPVSRVNNSTTTQPRKSTQNEQEDLESTALTKKKTRGQNRSKGTTRKGELHPVGVDASRLALEIGFIKGWKNVPPEDKTLIHTRIKDKFKIDLKEERHMHDKRSVAAAKNKAKVPYNHRGGSKSFIQHRTKGVRSLVNDVGEIELLRNTHWNAENGWCNEEARTRYDRMVELRRQH